MKTITRLILLSALAVLASCKENKGGGDDASGNEGFFFKQSFAYNLLTNPVIEIPVVRLGTSGDLTVDVAATGASEFSVPAQTVIKDGDRTGILEVTYDKNSLAFNTPYHLTVTIKDYSSVYGYEKADVTIEYPTSFYVYGKGTMNEEWWAEVEPDKTMYARDFAAGILECYVADCWGHDSGPGYDVQNYVFYWNTQNNMVYVPVQYMGWQYQSDMGAKTCRFGGPDHSVASANWYAYIDDYYKSHTELVHPHFDPDKRIFYLGDSNWFNANGVNTSSDPPAKNDSFVLD
jgi:hypothetical protein